MQKTIIKFTHPLTWFILAMLVFSFFRVLNGGHLNEVIRSDGRGYYAFLPALFIFNDGTFKASMAKEKEYCTDCTDQLYIYKDAQNKHYNKYFPGVAVMQLPFFGLACGLSVLLNLPVDGYSWVFSLFYYIGYLFYTLLGIVCFTKLLTTLFPEQKTRLTYLIPLLYVSSTLLFYSFNTPSFSHAYSIFLFCAFGLLILKLKNASSPKISILLGAVCGMIFLVRPTNILVLLIIPHLLGSNQSFKEFIRLLLTHRIKLLMPSIMAFSLVCSILFFSWKWQTGKWLLWSYNGEGFDFLHPNLFETLFSFRNGLFLHNPIMLVSLAAIIYQWKTDRYRSLSWMLYFIINIWVISSWWCWDYESPFGNRPLTEHYVFLLLPIITMFQTAWRKLSVSLLIFTCVIGFVRYYEITSGFMPDQRFTAKNYIKSLAFWDRSNKNRWQFTEECPPFGTVLKTYDLFNRTEVQHIKGEEFLLSGKAVLPPNRKNERYYYRVSVQKKHTNVTFEGIHLVLDGVSRNNKHRFYRCIPFYNDLKDGTGKWVELKMSGQVYDNLQQFDTISIYIWNQSKKNFDLKDVRIKLDVYKS